MPCKDVHHLDFVLRSSQAAVLAEKNLQAHIDSQRIQPRRDQSGEGKQARIGSIVAVLKSSADKYRLLQKRPGLHAKTTVSHLESLFHLVKRRKRAPVTDPQ